MHRLTSSIKQPRTTFWLYLSLAVPLYYGLISLHYALSQDYIVQDDTRHHVVWLQRFIDPQLFPHDLIADYFQTVAPVGFKAFYWLMAKVGIEPILLAKVLPTILGLITTAYLFQVFLKILPVPAGAFLATLILNQQIWLNDDLVSATGRAFVYPLFAAFLYYLLQRSLIPCLVTVALQGLFFPQLLLVEIAILTIRLFDWQRLPRLSREKADYVFWLSGLIVAASVMLPFALTISKFGTAITATQMRVMPEFGRGGRSEYFGVNPLRFIFLSDSGLQFPIFPSIILSGFGLPFLLKSRSKLGSLITAEVRILIQVSLASLTLFFLAHLFLLKLYFPSRYTYHTWRFVLAIASGIVLITLLDNGWRWFQQKRKSQLKRRELLLIGLTGLLAAIVIIVPAVPPIFLKFQDWVVGEESAVYRYLAAQPKDTLIASLASEANNLPAFSHRSTLVSREFALALHPRYYDQIKPRIVDVVRAQYSLDVSEVRSIIEQYGIDFFLLDRNSFNPNYLSTQDWLIYSSFKAVVLEAINQLKQAEIPALAQLVKSCAVLSTENLILLDAACINISKTPPHSVALPYY